LAQRLHTLSEAILSTPSNHTSLASKATGSAPQGHIQAQQKALVGTIRPGLFVVVDGWISTVTELKITGKENPPHRSAGPFHFLLEDDQIDSCVWFIYLAHNYYLWPPRSQQTGLTELP